MSAFCALSLRGWCVILGRAARIASKLTADRRRRAAQLRTDRTGGKTTPVQVLNLIAFVLAQVCVVDVQFHLPVKLCRLPHLRLFTHLGGALQN